MFVRSESGRAVVPLLFRTLYFCVAWSEVGTALPQAATDGDDLFEGASTAFALISSAQDTNTIPTTLPSPETAHTVLIPSPNLGIIPSQSPPSSDPQPSPESTTQVPPGIIPSQQPAISISQSLHVLIPSRSQPGLIASESPSVLIPSQSGPSVISSASLTFTSETEIAFPSTGPSETEPVASGSNVTSMPQPSTDEPLIPIPGATTAPGNPNGHHEISEPDFSITQSCRGCSPVVEVPATGFDDDWPPATPVAEPNAPSSSATPPKPPKATITAGSSESPREIVISKEPTGGNFVIGDSTTVAPGQTVVIGETPVVIQTSDGRTDIVVGGTRTIPFTPVPAEAVLAPVTPSPLLPALTFGTDTIAPDTASKYIVAGQTLIPGGPAITISATTISLAPSATALVLNGLTSTLAPVYGAVLTTTAAPLLTLNDHVYTANIFGNYVFAPGTTLAPGGPAITVDGTTISLQPEGTAAVIQGGTSAMRPLTTIVTLTKAGSGYGGSADMGTSEVGVMLPKPTGRRSSAGVLRVGEGMTQGWLEGVLLLATLAFGWLRVWL